MGRTLALASARNSSKGASDVGAAPHEHCMEEPVEIPPPEPPAAAPKSRSPGVRDARLVVLALLVFALTVAAVASLSPRSVPAHPVGPSEELAQADAAAPAARVKQHLLGERHLLGRVLDDRNQPLAGAEVRVTSLDDDDALPWTAISDGEGHFAFETLVEHALLVEVSRAGHDAAERALRADDAGELTFTLARQGELAVTVRDTPGNAVEGTLVTLTGPGLWPALELRANAHGEVLFENLAFGEYRVRARRAGRAAAASDKMRVVFGERAQIALTMDAALTLTAQVVDSISKTPLTEVEVLTYDEAPSIAPRSARSDATGAFALDGLLAGSVRLELRHPGHAPESIDVALPHAGTLRVELDGEAKLSGGVFDEQGRPIAGAMLSVSTREGLPVALDHERTAAGAGVGELGVTRGPVPKIPIFGGSEPGLGTLASESDAQGAFQVAGLAPVPMVLRATRAGYAESSLAVDQLAPHQELGELRVVLRQAGRVEGVIRDARGHGVAGVYVSAHAPGHTEQSTVSDATGQFALRDVLGEVTVTAEPQGYAPIGCKLNVSAGATMRCELQVGSTLYELPVRALDDYGFGLEGVVLTLTARGSTRAFTQVTRKDGSALLRELPEPPYQLEAALSGFVTQELEVREPERELRIKLTHAASLSGVVTDSLGHPVPNALVSTDEGDATSSTDARGNFVLNGVAPGALRVMAAHNKAGEGISGEVRARGGETLPSVRVVLSGRYSPSKEEPAGETAASETAGETVIEPNAKSKRPMTLTTTRRSKLHEFEIAQRGSEIVFSEVLSGGGMERAGVRAGDVLVTIDGEQVLSAAQARGMLRDPPGHFANLRLSRDKSQLRVRYKRPEL